MKPVALTKGMSIGLIAPSSAPFEPERLEQGIETLADRGYNVRRYRSKIDVYGYLAGTDQERLAELNTALADPETRFIFCARGGYGALRLLSGIDFDAARRYPKILVGYSDITALQLALWKHSGIRGLSGSMVAVDWIDPMEETEELFWSMLNSPAPIRLPRSGDSLDIVRPGSAEGILAGGNLTMITRLLGTPHFPDLDGAILFVEDVAEAPYRIDGLFAQLQLAGILDRIGGLVLGHFSGWEADDQRPTFTYREVIDHYTSSLDIPVVAGLPYGHTRYSYALPIGVRARIEANHKATATLTVLESLTR